MARALKHIVMPSHVLPGVPAWTAGESLYGWCSRYHLMYGRCVRQTGTDLFGRTHGYLLHVLPTGMAVFERATHSRLGEALDIVRNRTVAGAYWAYLGLEARRQLAECCASSSSLIGPLSACGFGPSLSLADHSLRFCEFCLRDEVHRLGVGLWDSAKQLPGVWVCTRHRCPLHVLRSKAIAWHLPEQSASVQVEVIGEGALKALARLACVMAATRQLDRVHPAGLAAACLARLMERGVIFGRSRGREVALQQWFDATPLGRWMKQATDIIALPSGRWISALLTNRRATHPLKWALLWTALSDGESDQSSVQAFVEAADDGDLVERYPQLPLWPVMRVPPPEGSDDSTIRAVLDRCASLSDAASQTGMSVHGLAQWMTHDVSLLRRWRSNATRSRTKASFEVVHSFFAKHPEAGWSEFIARHPNHVFWLRNKSPELFQRLLASHGLPPSPQLSLFDAPNRSTPAQVRSIPDQIEGEARVDS